MCESLLQLREEEVSRIVKYQVGVPRLTDHSCTSCGLRELPRPSMPQDTQKTVTPFVGPLRQGMQPFSSHLRTAQYQLLRQRGIEKRTADVYWYGGQSLATPCWSTDEHPGVLHVGTEELLR